MRFSVLASGSSGNAIYIESARTKLLVDGGLSGKELERRLFSIDVNPAQLSGILVTHEHHDHIQGVGILARRYDLPVYIHPDTLAAAGKRLGVIPTVRSMRGGLCFEIGDLNITPFPIPHDAANPMGFTFSRDGKKLGLATDMGYATALSRARLKGANALILESNHDMDMLKKGPYTWPLKQRIMSRVGHLSNHDSSLLLNDLMHGDLRTVVLAHLSEVNNLPEIAYDTAKRVVQGADREIRLVTAYQDEAGDLIEV